MNINGRNIKTIDLRKLNSMTKYPSISTFHEMGDRGVLQPSQLQLPPDTSLHITEKIDGSNSRIIVLPRNAEATAAAFIGSREELLYFTDDLLYNPTANIVDAIRPILPGILKIVSKDITVLYMESYGGKIGGRKIAKHYSGTGKVGRRLFDVQTITMERFEHMMRWPIEDIALWREKGGQQFLSMDKFSDLSADLVLKHDIYVVPHIGIINTDEFMDMAVPPCGGFEETLTWMKDLLPKTNVALDGDADSKPEGIVVRTEDRRFIAKLRFEDYERTIKILSKYSTIIAAQNKSTQKGT